MAVFFKDFLVILENAMIKQMLDKLPGDKIKPMMGIVRKELHTFIPNEKYRALLSQYVTYLLHDRPSKYIIDDIKKFWQEYGALLTSKENDAKFRSRLTDPTFGRDQLSAENLRYHQELRVGKNKNKGGEGLPIVDVAQVLAANQHLTDPIPEGVARKHNPRDDDDYPGYAHEEQDTSNPITDQDKKIYDTSSWIGWNWVSLGKKSCGEEAAAGGHCGNASGEPDDNIISLRDSRNRVHLTFILNNGSLGEAKGTNNDRPEVDYHPAIAALLLSGYVKRYMGGGYAPEANFHPSDFPQEVEHYVLSHMDQLPTHKIPDNVWTKNAIINITQKEVNALPIDRKTSLLQSFIGRLADSDDPSEIGFSQHDVRFSIPRLIEEIRPHISPRAKIGIFVDAAMNKDHNDNPTYLLSSFADDVIAVLSTINSQASLSNFFQGLIADHRGDQAAKTLRRMSDIGPLKEEDVKMINMTIREFSNTNGLDLSGVKDVMRDNLLDGKLKINPKRIPETTEYFNNPNEFAAIVKHKPEIFGDYDFADRIREFKLEFATALITNDAVQSQNISPDTLMKIIGFTGLKKLQSIGKFDFNNVDHNLLFNWFNQRTGMCEELLKNKLLDLNNLNPADIMHVIGVRFVKEYAPEYFPKLQAWCRDQIYNHTISKETTLTKNPANREWNPRTIEEMRVLFPQEEVDKMIYGGLIDPVFLGWNQLKLNGYNIVKVAHAFNVDFEDMRGSSSHNFFDNLTLKSRHKDEDGDYYTKKDYTNIIQHVEHGELSMKAGVYNYLPASYVFHWAMTHGEDPKMLKNSIDRLTNKTYLIDTIEGQTCLKENSYWSPYSIANALVGSRYNAFRAPLGDNFRKVIMSLGKNPYEEYVENLGGAFTKYVASNYITPQIQNHVGLKNKDEFGIFFTIDQNRVNSGHDHQYVWTQTLEDFYKLFLVEYQKDPMFSENYRNVFMEQCKELESRPNQWFARLMVTLTPEQILPILYELDPRLKQSQAGQPNEKI